MYLSQSASAFLFTVIRQVLQISSVFFITHTASRSYNLTYLERINGGFLTRVNYLLFAKLPSGHNHSLGRFYVGIVLVITLALNYLPTLLSDLYPVQPVFLESSSQPFNISARFIKPTSLVPSQTNVSTILLNMGVSLGDAQVFGYSETPSPQRTTCQPKSQGYDCSENEDEEVFITFPYRAGENPLALGYGMDSDNSPRNALGPAGEQFAYFNFTSNRLNSYSVVDMYRQAVYYALKDDESFHPRAVPNGPRSLEQCLFRTKAEGRCVRDSLTYVASDPGVFLVSRRVSFQTIRAHIDDAADSEDTEDIGGTVITNKPPDCSALANAALETLCRQLNSLGTPSTYLNEFRMHTVQNRTEASDGSFTWDVVTAYVDHPIVDETYWIIEALHIDVSFSFHDSTVDYYFINNINDDKTQVEIETQEQEVFEATYFVPRAIPLSNRTWASWGFSAEDKANLTNFLLGATILNDGTLIIRTPSLLANVSNIVVGILFGLAAILLATGALLAWGVPAIVRLPLTEVLAEVATQDKNKMKKKSSKNPLRRRKIASLMLVPQASNDDDPEAATGGDDGNGASKVTKSKTSPPALTLRMEIDNNNHDSEEFDTIQLLDTTHNHQDHHRIPH
ncbi:hypothetical protein BGW38_000819 [Lunasporangiospora selenospora]|uniref:Uncharacterized protein n=1 Tax=Lunasporangiospora selenospora TaxID=979761 RepID=A0A9P6G3R5_9FUNG|nr:hypothetical protein BGW38_000819 [Lunasporangiospora selenospora]